MKKSIPMRAAGALFIGVMLTAGMVSGSFAKYVTQDSRLTSSFISFGTVCPGRLSQEKMTRFLLHRLVSMIVERSWPYRSLDNAFIFFRKIVLLLSLNGEL